MSEIRQKFEEVAREMFGESMERGPYGNLLERASHFSDEYKFADVQAAWRTYQAAWRAAYEAGEIAMKEKAAQLANSCAQILPPEHRVGATWIGAQIHALPLSGAEESKKEKA